MCNSKFENYSVNQIGSIKKGDLVGFVSKAHFPGLKSGRINIKAWRKRSFKGYFEGIQLFRVTKDYFFDKEK